jgi:predicted HicB family RNase H-like nuclease
MNFDPEAYTLTIRKENVDGYILFVGRVAELQDVIAYEESYEEAHTILLDAISSLKEIADEQNRTFPVPFETEDEYSGRVTLRFTKTLHKSASLMAEREGVSLNQFLNTVVAEAVGERKGKASSVATALTAHGHSNIVNFPTAHQEKRQPSNTASAASATSILVNIKPLSQLVS